MFLGEHFRPLSNSTFSSMTSIKQVYQIWQKYKAKKISYFSEWIQEFFNSWDKLELNENKWKKNYVQKTKDTTQKDLLT